MRMIFLRSPKSLFFFYLLISLLFVPISCATIISPKSYPIYIESNEKDVELTFVCRKGNSKHILEYSNVLYVSANDFCSLEFKKPGYEDQNIELNYRINAAIIGNLYIPGILFLPVDIMNGYYKKLDTINIKLEMIKSNHGAK